MILASAFSSTSFADAVSERQRETILESRRKCVAFIGRKILKNHYSYKAEKEVTELLKKVPNRATAAKDKDLTKKILFSKKLDKRLLKIFLKYAKRSEAGETEMEKQFNLDLMTAQVRKVFKNKKINKRHKKFWAKCFKVHAKAVKNCQSIGDEYEQRRCYKKFDKDVQALI
jgi:hypothetical protein